MTSLQSDSTVDFQLTENGKTISISKAAMNSALQQAISVLASNPASRTCPNSTSEQYAILSSTY